MTAVTTSCRDHGLPGDKDGYALVMRGGVRHGAHRWALADHLGVPIASLKGKMVLHSCDSPRCIEPSHLRLGTHADNMMDKSLRRRDHSIKLSEEAVAYIRANCRHNKPGDNRENPVSYAALGRKFGVNPASIRRAHLGMTFRHKEAT